MLVIHPHFHRRRTGVTRHVESVVPALAHRLDARALGTALDTTVPRIGWRELLCRLRREPAVWHAHRNHELLVGLVLRLIAKALKLVFTRHSAHPQGAFTRLLARRADRRISLTEQGASTLALSSTVIGHGVDLARFRPSADRDAAWARLGVGGQFGIGVIGRIRPTKGQGDFVDAVSPLLPHHPEWRAALVGLAKPKERAWAESLRDRCAGSLLLTGEQQDVLRWYQGLTVLVQPSRAEGFSLVLLEALASGCCVVAARLPHYARIVEHGRTGFLYAPGDVHELRAILEPLLREPQRAQEVGRNAAEEAARRWGVEHEASALAEVYRALAGEG